MINDAPSIFVSQKQSHVLGKGLIRYLETTSSTLSHWTLQVYLTNGIEAACQTV